MKKVRARDLNMQFLQSADWNWEQAWDAHKSTLLSEIKHVIASFVDLETGTIETDNQWH